MNDIHGLYLYLPCSEADASMGAFIASSDSEEAEMDSEEDFASVPNTVSATGQCVAEESDEAEMSDRGEERTMLASFKGYVKISAPYITSY